MKLDAPCCFEAPLWKYDAPKASWYFITLPKDEAARIKLMAGAMPRGWGSVPVKARIGETEWQTSIFPSKSSESYILPIKAAVRKAERLTEGSQARITLTFTL